MRQCIISVHFITTGSKAEALGAGNCGDIYVNRNETHFSKDEKQCGESKLLLLEIPSHIWICFQPCVRKMTLSAQQAATSCRQNGVQEAR